MKNEILIDNNLTALSIDLEPSPSLMAMWFLFSSINDLTMFKNENAWGAAKAGDERFEYLLDEGGEILSDEEGEFVGLVSFESDAFVWWVREYGVTEKLLSSTDAGKLYDFFRQNINEIRWRTKDDLKERVWNFVENKGVI